MEQWKKGAGVNHEKRWGVQESLAKAQCRTMMVHALMKGAASGGEAGASSASSTMGAVRHLAERYRVQIRALHCSDF